MTDLHLVIGNKNYSSWSLRPWIAMKAAGLSFRETLVPLDTPETGDLIRKHSRGGKVPVLHHGSVTIWESLAILEYLAETFPEAGIWPDDRGARAVARAVASEMHAGFAALRNRCPMNLRRTRKPIDLDDRVKADIASVQSLWRDCRERFGGGGPFLFGSFSGADAMFAPVVTRFDTYAIELDSLSRDYADAILAFPAFREWQHAALREPWVLSQEEVDK